MTDEKNIKIFCRIKPIRPTLKSCISLVNERKVKVTAPSIYRREKKEVEYTFSRIFDADSTQEDVCREVALPLLNNVVNGKDGLLFTFGVTGTGKTYTMIGNPDRPGFIPRILKSLFDHLEIIRNERIIPDGRNGYKTDGYLNLQNYMAERDENHRRSIDQNSCVFFDNIKKMELDGKIENCTAFMSMVELYGDKVTDLLDCKSGKEVTIKEDARKCVYVHNAREIEVHSAAEALSFFLQGRENRTTAATTLNARSSRSHMIFILKIVRKVNMLSSRYQVTQLSLADLAGSERASRSDGNHAQVREGGFINNSLMSLKMCLKSVSSAKNERNYVNMKANKLTYMFKNVIEGFGSIRMVICVQGLSEEYSETLNVLEFAESSQEIRLPTQEKRRILQIPRNAPKGMTLTKKDRYADIRDKISLTIHLFKKLKEEMKSRENERSIIVVLEDLTKLMKFNSDTVECNKMILSEHISNNKKRKRCIEQTQNVLKKEKQRAIEWKLKAEKKSEQFFELQKKLTDKDKKLGQECSDKAGQRLLMEKVKRKLDETEAENKRLKAIIKDLNKSEKENLLNRPSAVITDENRKVKMLAKRFDNGRNNANVNVTHYNPRYRKRKSLEKKLLKHVDKNEVPTGTLNEIQNFRKTPVTITSKPNSKDLKKIDEYVLQQQTVDSDLDLTTNYHKAHVIPTAGGGYAVQYYETETVRQSSPFKYNTEVNKLGKRKRSMSDTEAEVAKRLSIRDDMD